MQELDQRLRSAVSQRDTLATEVSKIEGRKEAAEASLAQVQDEIRAKNLDPDTLGQSIALLEEAFEKEVTAFEKEVDDARTALSPYMKMKDSL